MALQPHDAPEVSLLEGLATEVAGGRRGGQGTDAVAAAVARCLDEAALGRDMAGRWALDEGAAWSLAWLLRSKRPGVAGLVERLAVEGRAADAVLRGGDLAPAPLLVTLLGLFPGLPGGTPLEDIGAVLAADLAAVTAVDGAPKAGPALAFVARVLAWTRVRAAAELSGCGVPWDEATEATDFPAPSMRCATSMAVRQSSPQPSRIFAVTGTPSHASTTRATMAPTRSGSRRSHDPLWALTVT